MASEVSQRLLIKAKILGSQISFLTPEIDPRTFQNMDLDTKILKIGQQLAVLGHFSPEFSKFSDFTYRGRKML